MENKYLKGYSRQWHSEKVDISSYFDLYSRTIKKFSESESIMLEEICNLVLGIHNTDPFQMVLLPQELDEITNESQLKLLDFKTNPRSLVYSTNNKAKTGKKHTNSLSQLSMKDKKCVGDTLSRLNETSSSNTRCSNRTNDEVIFNAHDSEDIFRDSFVDENKTQNQTSYRENSRIKNIPVYRQVKITGLQKNKVKKLKNQSLLKSKLWLHGPPKTGTKTLETKKHFIMSFRIHEPFQHHDNNARTESFLQEIFVLGHQTLEHLRDKIVCHTDFQDVEGDISENPDIPIKKISRDKYKSAMFYFDNTFYIDRRPKDYVDYSSVIKSWAQLRGIELGPTKDMTCQAIQNLHLRFGYPYVYIHQGCCEHLVVLNDARLLTNKDSLSDCDYPLFSSLSPRLTDHCVTCTLKRPATWVVTGSSRMIYDINFMCTDCFKRFNYKNGKKCDDFKAFRYCQKSMLL